MLTGEGGATKGGFRGAQVAFFRHRALPLQAQRTQPLRKLDV
ncbi:Hypothetical protein A7982_02587 [Minicystis rosea]|nr:Hypothetical protein A7982_02587 [Minicystis rosea]